MEEKYECFRFQCPNYLQCAVAAGTGCCVPRDPSKEEVPDGSCMKENGYPYYVKKEGESLRDNPWMRRY